MVDTITEQIVEVGIEIVNTELVKDEHMQPFNHFGSASSTDDLDA